MSNNNVQTALITAGITSLITMGVAIILFQQENSNINGKFSAQSSIISSARDEMAGLTSKYEKNLTQQINSANSTVQKLHNKIQQMQFQIRTLAASKSVIQTAGNQLTSTNPNTYATYHWELVLDSGTGSDDLGLVGPNNHLWVETISPANLVYDASGKSFATLTFKNGMPHIQKYLVGWEIHYPASSLLPKYGYGNGKSKSKNNSGFYTGNGYGVGMHTS